MDVAKLQPLLTFEEMGVSVEEYLAATYYKKWPFMIKHPNEERHFIAFNIPEYTGREDGLYVRCVGCFICPVFKDMDDFISFLKEDGIKVSSLKCFDKRT